MASPVPYSVDPGGVVLVLSRKVDQAIVLGEDIRVIVLGIEGDRVKLGIRAPQSTAVLRGEVYEQLQTEGAEQRVRSDNH